MRLDLPDDHPIAEAIRDATGPGWKQGGRLFLSLDHLTAHGELERVTQLEIDQWTTTRHTEIKFECELTDPEVRTRQLTALLAWPELPSEIP